MEFLPKDLFTVMGHSFTHRRFSIAMEIFYQWVSLMGFTTVILPKGPP
jgi:hypothetical protein